MRLQSNKWCSEGVDLLAKQQLDKFNTSDGAQTALATIEQFLASGAHAQELANSPDLQTTFDCVMSVRIKVSERVIYFKRFYTCRTCTVFEAGNATF